MRRSTVALAAVLLAAGCDPAATPPAPRTSDSSAPPATVAAFVPSFEAADCPQDVRDVTVVPVTCGYLTVLEDRSAPASRRLRLLVTKVEPHDGAVAADPMIVLEDIRTGGIPDYGGIVEVANRVGRTEYILDPRGRAHGDPILDCPEITQASLTLVGLSLADPVHEEALRGAVAACRDRLIAGGTNPTLYGVDDIVADLHDLRIALGIESWNAIAYGPASEVAFAIAGPDLETLRSITLDSPTLGQASWRTLGPAALDAALARLQAACAAAAACSATHPDVRASIDEAVQALETKPLTLDVDGTPQAILAGHPIRVRIDGTAFLRWVRSQVGRQRPDGAMLLDTVARARARTLTSRDLIAVQLSSDIGDCLGTLPRCDVDLAWGSIFSLVCSAPLAPAEIARLTDDVGGRRAYGALFLRGPLEIACAEWPATGGSTDPGSVIGAGVPIVIFRGQFDPFAATSGAISAETGDGSNVHIVEIPNGSSNVLGGFECARSVRNSWVDEPLKPPGDTACIASIPEIPLPS